MAAIGIHAWNPRWSQDFATLKAHLDAILSPVDNT